MTDSAETLEETRERVVSVLSIRGARVVQRIRESQWFLPFVGVVIGVAFSLFIARESDALSKAFPATAWRVTATEARNFLLAFVGIEITALSIVMALTMVTVQNAANQFSPRLLRVYLRDWVQQAVLTVIAGSTAYFIAASILIGVPGTPEAAPQPVIGFSVLLIPISGVALVIQINHTLQMIRIEVLMHKVAHATVKTADFTQHERHGDGIIVAERIYIEPWATPVHSTKSGYVIRIQGRVLAEVAQNHNCVVRIDAGIGEPVLTGVPIGWIQPPQPDETVPDSVISAVRSGVGIDNWRDPTYDVALGVRQLVDVGVKALSPSINDPRTAVQAVDQLKEILVNLAVQDTGDHTIYDTDGRPLVQFHSPSFFDYMLLATDQIARYGREEPTVLLRLVQMCGGVGYVATRPEDKEVSGEILNSIMDEAGRHIEDPFWLEVLRRVAGSAREQIGGSMTPENQTPYDL